MNKSKKEKKRECDHLKETAHAIMNADTDYDAQKILESVLKKSRSELIKEIKKWIDKNRIIEYAEGTPKQIFVTNSSIVSPQITFNSYKEGYNDALDDILVAGGLLSSIFPFKLF